MSWSIKDHFEFLGHHLASLKEKIRMLRLNVYHQRNFIERMKKKGSWSDFFVKTHEDILAAMEDKLVDVILQFDTISRRMKGIE